MSKHHPLITLALIAAAGASAIAQPSIEDQPEQISQYIREIYQDKRGDYWFGTNGPGAIRYDGETLTAFSFDEGFHGRAIRGIVEAPDGALWFATDVGVVRYHDGNITNYSDGFGLANIDVWSIMRDSRGVIWIGTHTGVCRFNGEWFEPFTLPQVKVENPESRFSPHVVFAMLEDSGGNLWFATDGQGVHRYDGKSFTSYTTKDGLTGNQVRALCEDRDGNIWIGTDGAGASRFDGKSFTNFTIEHGLNNNRIFEIYETTDGALWFSTLGAGASRYDGDTFEEFSEAQGLSANDLPCPCGMRKRYRDCHGPNGAHVQEFYEDASGNLWFGCSGGLFRLDGDKVINITREGPWP